MLKRALLATVAALSILPAALAATPALNFAGIFGQLIVFLGPSGVDFLMAFGIVAAVAFMAISRIPTFQDTPGGRAGAAMFAVLGGLATAFYVYMQKIPFLQLIGPYFIFILAIMLGLLAVQIFASFREGTTFAGKAATVGLGGIIIGTLVLFFAPALATLGVLILFIGIIAFFVAGISWAGGFRPSSLISREERYETREEREESTEEVVEEEEEAKIERELSQGMTKAALKDLKVTFKQRKKIIKQLKNEQKSLNRQYKDLATITKKLRKLMSNVPSQFDQTYINRLENLEREEQAYIKEKEALIVTADKDMREAFELLEKGDANEAYALIRQAATYDQQFRQVNSKLNAIGAAKNRMETQIRNLLKGQRIKT